ncbi:hypothetical protein OG21DRAFT_1513044 [Imleria badia]|nr:hypothetical protein OG21DRAFT_1513044 [Imleria badia]
MSNNKTHQMDKVAATRIQSHADRTNTNQDFKSRAQSTADRREYAQTSRGSGGAPKSNDKK